MKVQFESDRPAEQTTFRVVLVPGVQDLPDDVAKAMLAAGAAGLSAVVDDVAETGPDPEPPSNETERPPRAPRNRQKEG